MPVSESHSQSQSQSQHNHELTGPSTVFRSEQRFTDPALAAADPQPDWFAATPPTGIPLDPIPAAAY